MRGPPFSWSNKLRAASQRLHQRFCHTVCACNKIIRWRCPTTRQRRTTASRPGVRQYRMMGIWIKCIILLYQLYSPSFDKRWWRIKVLFLHVGARARQNLFCHQVSTRPSIANFFVSYVFPGIGDWTIFKCILNSNSSFGSISFSVTLFILLRFDWSRRVLNANLD